MTEAAAEIHRLLGKRSREASKHADNKVSASKQKKHRERSRKEINIKMGRRRRRRGMKTKSEIMCMLTG